jgi:DNA-binding NarL/FixJ family response regulator
MTAERPIEVVVIDDNKRIRFIVKETLRTERDIHICDEAETVERARELLAARRPDVAILDISLGEDEGGLKLLKEFTALPGHPTQFIILSAHNETNYSGRSLEAGARGYVCKDKTVQCLAEAIRSVRSGKRFVSSDSPA